MKVLVFDDNSVNRETAVLSLAGHDLTVVSTYDEAQKALVPVTDDKAFRELRADLLEKAGLPRGFFSVDRDVVSPIAGFAGKKTSKEDNQKYQEAKAEARAKTTIYPDFDVVLTDLMVLPSKQAQGDKEGKLMKQEMPLGTTIALLALAVGIKNVAVVTDTDHHDHPASAAFDCFRGLGAGRNLGANIVCTGCWQFGIDEMTGEGVSSRLSCNELEKKYPYNGDLKKREGLRQGKDWGRALRQLLGEDDG
ncbi:MAG: hypothetical protein V1704_01515 [Candidatus Vogelbacteria bacterium]